MSNHLKTIKLLLSSLHHGMPVWSTFLCYLCSSNFRSTFFLLIFIALYDCFSQSLKTEPDTVILAGTSQVPLAWVPNRNVRPIINMVFLQCIIPYCTSLLVYMWKGHTIVQYYTYTLSSHWTIWPYYPLFLLSFTIHQKVLLFPLWQKRIIILKPEWS